MTLQALLVSKDDDAADVLSRVLANLGVAIERFSDPEVAENRLSEHRFDALIVDFEEPQTAGQLLQVAQASASSAIVTVALVHQECSVREVLKAGARFILYKPISPDHAAAGLAAATALLKRERRSSFRVAVQAPVQLSLPGGDPMEGIMLDLSQSGMDVLAAQPLQPAALVGVRFTLPDGSLEIDAHGEVAWANPNGQSGVRFLDIPADVQEKLQAWLLANSPEVLSEDAEFVSRCKLTDLSLGGCYVETDSPFPEQALVDLCLKAEDMEIHAEGVVRIMHPGSGMGLEFPSRTAEQRETVAKFIDFLAGRPGTMPELLISPRSLAADQTQFQPTDAGEMDDPLLELLRNGPSLSEEQFLTELRRQRSSESVASD
jgi:DNA-binding response OmpR family regulator